MRPHQAFTPNSPFNPQDNKKLFPIVTTDLTFAHVSPHTIHAPTHIIHSPHITQNTKHKMADHPDDDLVPTRAEGYKLGEKKTVDEYAKLDAEDEALNRWKASLGIGADASIGDPNDKRPVVILELALEVEGRPDVVIELEQPGALEALTGKPFTIKEKAQYSMRVKFRVQHEVISGLRYLQRVKRKGVTVDKSEEMMGSFAPNTLSTPVYEKKFAKEEAPSGMLFRGHYEVLSRFMDDDHRNYLQFEWSFDIKKSWE